MRNIVGFDHYGRLRQIKEPCKFVKSRRSLCVPAHTQSKLLLDASISNICEKYTFEYRNPQEMDDTVLYAEPTLQGNAAICKRQEGKQETQMNLELLFNAVINGKLND